MGTLKSFPQRRRSFVIHSPLSVSKHYVGLSQGMNDHTFNLDGRRISTRPHNSSEEDGYIGDIAVPEDWRSLKSAN